MTTQRTNATPADGASSSTQVIQVIHYIIAARCIRIHDRTAKLSPGHETRVTEITINRVDRTIEVSERTLNPCEGSPPCAVLGEADRMHEDRVIEMLRAAVRDHGDYWYEHFPGMVETLGVRVNADRISSGKMRMRMAYGHPMAVSGAVIGDTVS
ncbi:hypothetical protein BJY00DRAFT_309825 [Aspergillus carlsbadensis]|nr:hypothetical protein BJY00DRAFT_309825 [Aspergillus carlsbadensis]